MKASIVLNPNESKRLIAKGVAQLPVIKEALKSGTVVIGFGSTNGYVAEELLGQSIDKDRFVAGFNDGVNNVTKPDKRDRELVIIEGELTDKTSGDVRDELTCRDVFIKGGNALDPYGVVGVMVGSKSGGTVGANMGYVVSCGVNLIIPIGLEKAIHNSVEEVSQEIGITKLDRYMGAPIGLWPLYGVVVTELEAIELLAEVRAFQIGAGGIAGGEGSVTLGVAGEKPEVKKIFELAEKIKGEPPISPRGAYEQ